MAQVELLAKIETLQQMLLARATGGSADDAEYRALRAELLSDSTIRPRLPRFVVTSRDLSQFWSFIKLKYPTYDERRQYIWGEFAPLIEQLEGSPTSPADESISHMLSRLDGEHVHEVWQRALDRRIEDPEGAITSARTLLESVCKTILDDMRVEYPDHSDLPKLYSLTAQQLNLAPSQHTEKIFKQILGSCQAVVEGLGTLRNRLGDAHGQGSKPVKPASRHAELAVNLSGTMATFLVSTWEFQKHEGT